MLGGRRAAALRRAAAALCLPPAALCLPPAVLCRTAAALCLPPAVLCLHSAALCLPPAVLCLSPAVLCRLAALCRSGCSRDCSNVLGAAAPPRRASAVCWLPFDGVGSFEGVDPLFMVEQR